MASLLGQFVRKTLFMAVLGLAAACSTPEPSGAAPYAAVVMDARTGEILHSNNGDARLHPASLTKMLTLYIAFEAIQRGEISLDTMVTVSKNAAAEPPSKLGLRAGQKIALRHLIRAAAVKSANDAATAIGEAVAGSEAQFAARMNRTAKAIGMKSSTFKNAHGLTASGHLSTARDMTVMGRRLFFDYPQYYNIFSRRTADAGIAEVANTNRRFLDNYKGADGIKTGYTNAAGFNLTASAERGNKRIIATVFGGQSTAHRNAKMAELLNLGFGEAPNNARVKKPGAPVYDAANDVVAAAPEAAPDAAGGRSAGKTIRVAGAVTKSLRPKTRPGQAAAAGEVVLAMKDSIAGAVAEAAAPVVVAEVTPEPTPDAASIVSLSAGVTSLPEPKIRPTAPVERVAAVAPQPAVVVAEKMPVPTEPEVITRLSTSGGRHWGVNVGRFPSRSVAERTLMKIALAENATLNDGLRKIVQRGGGYDANFMGLTQDQADLACRRLQARAVQCFAIGP
ncbi:D-alanyl-D-alanine carboxypeptidase family protein [Fertoeibacter niger]|uniref:D-alanyl-D-alanine carboxypeptidase family protein n=1 Tax=Fertoeibacter niger TaxID=2656921 RepID=UPI003B972CF2